MAKRYNFKYLPLVGKLPGKSMVEQTETAINELASVVYDNVGHVGNLAEEVQTANANASNALEKATEALETSGRVYIKQIAAVDVNDYYDSELYYINNDGSTNIPVRDRGFLEVKTNDDKTACEQVFIADSTGTPYYRHGRITKQTVGKKTTYVVTWSSWHRVATTEYVQAELQDYVTLNNLETELQDYLPLSGGTLTGVVNGVTPPNGDNSKKLATTEFVNATAPQADWNVTDSSSKAFIKNKPAVYPCAKTLEIEDTRAQINTPSFFINNYNRRIKSDFKVEDSPEAKTFSSFITITPWDNNTGGYPSQLAFTAQGNIFYRIGSSDEKWGNWKRIPLEGETIDFNKPVKENGGFLVPIGVVQAFAGTTIPSGWLLCDGSAVSRTTYANLYACIGTTYGAGNGSTTFNLPNLTDKFIQGSATAGTVKSAGLPNITGSVWNIAGKDAAQNGAFRYVPHSTFADLSGGSSIGAGNFTIDASLSSSVYGGSSTVQPPALTMRYIIKY